jgi:hypothetical protein
VLRKYEHTAVRAKPISSRVRLIRLRLSVYQRNLPWIKMSFPYVRCYNLRVEFAAGTTNITPEDVRIPAFIHHLHECLKVARDGRLQGRNA